MDGNVRDLAISAKRKKGGCGDGERGNDREREFHLKSCDKEGFGGGQAIQRHGKGGGEAGKGGDQHGERQRRRQTTTDKDKNTGE